MKSYETNNFVTVFKHDRFRDFEWTVSVVLADPDGTSAYDKLSKSRGWHRIDHPGGTVHFIKRVFFSSCWTALRVAVEFSEELGLDMCIKSGHVYQKRGSGGKVQFRPMLDADIIGDLTPYLQEKYKLIKPRRRKRNENRKVA